MAFLHLDRLTWRHAVRNLLYLCYFITHTDYRALIASWRCARTLSTRGLDMFADMLRCSLRYGASFVDYFNFRFFEKDDCQRSTYATMGDMYKFHAWANLPQDSALLNDKQSFAKLFSGLCHTSYFFLSNQEQELRSLLMDFAFDSIVVKDPVSTAGRGVRFMPVKHGKPHELMIGELTFEKFVRIEFKKSDGLYIEPLIEQHPILHQLSPSGVNTIRMITMLGPEGKPDIIGSVLRISVNSRLDNFSKGNLAAEIDTETGVVITGGIRKQAACDIYHDRHPVTESDILGLSIPFWRETQELVRKAALVLPGVRTVGWDVAITKNGPVLIEGNSKWNKDTWQIPAGCGKKDILRRYMPNI